MYMYVYVHVHNVTGLLHHHLQYGFWYVRDRELVLREARKIWRKMEDCNNKKVLMPDDGEAEGEGGKEVGREGGKEGGREGGRRGWRLK